MENKSIISNKVKLVVAAIAIIILGFFAYSKLAPKDNSLGTVTIEVVELDGTVSCTKEIALEEGDTLISIVESNFANVTISDGFLYTIETLTTPEDWSTFICIYVDGEESQVGISDIQLTDGLTVTFKSVELTY